jgi:sporulation protein YlmC with PRC-barrel domain
MEICIGDIVRGRDGDLGKVERFLIDQRTGKVEHLVIGGGPLQSDRAIPIDCISGVDHGVLADIDKDGWEEMPTWSTDLFRAKSVDYEGPPSEDLEGVDRGEFLLDETVASGSYGFLSGKSGGFPGDEQLVSDDRQLADIGKGTDVLDFGGEKIADVDDVTIDASNGTLERVVMRRGLILGHESEIPLEWIDRVQPGQLLLKVTKHEVEAHDKAA